MTTATQTQIIVNEPENMAHYSRMKKPGAVFRVENSMGAVSARCYFATHIGQWEEFISQDGHGENIRSSTGSLISMRFNCNDGNNPFLSFVVYQTDVVCHPTDETYAGRKQFLEQAGLWEQGGST